MTPSEKEIKESPDIGIEKQSITADDVPPHLLDLYNKASQDLNKDEQMLLAETLVKCQDAFSKDDTDLGRTHLAEHDIDTGTAYPIKQRPRRTPIAFANEEKTAIDDLKEKGVIRESTSPWASPLVLVRKKCGKVRLCVDYRKVNSVTKKDAFPIPRIQDCLDAVSGAKCFSTFDLLSGYHQVPVKESDINKTAFVTKYGIFEFITLPFGLTNAPATFQRIMELALRGLQWQICLIYLDDIIVFGSTFEEHLGRVEKVLQRIIKAGLKLQPKKCQLFQKTGQFPGTCSSCRRCCS